jgi:uncharacterized protein
MNFRRRNGELESLLNNFKRKGRKVHRKGRKGFLILFLLFGFVLPLRAQEYSSLLWEIKGKGLSQPSYIYGTVHSFDSKAFRYVSQLAPKIAASDIFAMEMILDMQSQNLMDLMQYAIMPGDTTISMLLEPADYDRLSQYMTDSVGLPMMMLGKMKPFFLMAMMTEQSSPQDAARFLDDSLSQIAKLAKKKVIGIETMKEQLSAIDQITLREQATMLMQEVDSALTSSSTKQMDEFMELYATGSLDSLHTQYQEHEFSNTFQLALVTDRNHRMADRIEAYLTDKMRMFVAVGALHLPGEEGVINLLRKKGFSVTPVKLK